MNDGKVCLKLCKPCYTGQTQLVLEPIAFVKLLFAILPPPRWHLTRYHGQYPKEKPLRLYPSMLTVSTNASQRSPGGKTMCINKALLEDMVREIYESEGELFELDVGEWALAFRLGLRLVAAVEGGDNPDLRVDCEYNKLGKNKKTVAGKERRPDIIVHRRGDSDKNVLAIECKRILNGNKGERRLDVDKLLNLKEDENFAYECVALVEFGGTMGDTVVSWGEEGLKGRKHELE